MKKTMVIKKSKPAKKVKMTKVTAFKSGKPMMNMFGGKK